MKWRRNHLNQQHKERQDLEDRRLMAEEKREKYSDQPLYALLSADFMTATRGDTPHYRGEQMSPNHFEQRVCAVEVVCGDIVGFFVYVVDNLAAKGANVMIEIQRQSLIDLAELLKEKNFKMPEKLFLQFDNGRENKNKEMFCYLSMLVEERRFESIQVNFLIVGHTHSKVDQYFSTMSKLIKAQSFIATPPAFRFLLGTMIGQRPLRPPRQIDILYDYVQQFAAHRYKYSFYTTPHEFRFQLRGGKCTMVYKMFSDREQYLPREPEVVKGKVSHPLADDDPQAAALQDILPRVSSMEVPDLYEYSGNRKSFLALCNMSDPPNPSKEKEFTAFATLRSLHGELLSIVRDSSIAMYGPSKPTELSDVVASYDDNNDIYSEWHNITHVQLQEKSNAERGFIVWLRTPAAEIPPPMPIYPKANGSGAKMMVATAAALIRIADKPASSEKIQNKPNMTEYDRLCFAAKFFTKIDRDYCLSCSSEEAIVERVA